MCGIKIQYQPHWWETCESFFYATLVSIRRKFLALAIVILLKQCNFKQAVQPLPGFISTSVKLQSCKRCCQGLLWAQNTFIFLLYWQVFLSHSHHFVLLSQSDLDKVREDLKISLKDISVHQEIKLKGKTENGMTFISVWKSSLTFTIQVQFEGDYI